jgi:hypothetical protein
MKFRIKLLFVTMQQIGDFFFIIRMNEMKKRMIKTSLQIQFNLYV